MLSPTFTETLYQSQVPARLQQIGAKFLREKSTPGKYVYWVPSRNTWILVTPKVQDKVLLGYYQMEKCPCDS